MEQIISNITSGLPVIFYECINDEHWTMTFITKGCLELTGYDDEQLIKNESLSYNDLIHPDDQALVTQIVNNSISYNEPFNVEYRIKTKNGKIKWVWEQGKVVDQSIHGFITDITSQKKRLTNLEQQCLDQEKTIHDQNMDKITQLSNRQKFQKDLNENKIDKIAIIDLINFGTTNQLLGYDGGSEILKKVGKWLFDTTEKMNLYLYKDVEDNYIIASNKKMEEATFIGNCNKIISDIKLKTFQQNDNEINIGARIGVSFSKDLYTNAKKSIKKSKQEQTNLVIFDKDIMSQDTSSDKNINITTLNSASLKDHIIVYARPLLNTQSKEIEQYECFARYKDDQGNIINSSEFMSLAMQNNLYSEVSQIIIEKSFECFSQNNLNFSISLLTKDILDIENAMFLESYINQYKIGEQLTIEILEINDTNRFNEINEFIRRIKKYGVKVSIADFGTGYCNFDFLMKFNVDLIKIDKSIIQNILKNKSSKHLVSLICDFANKIKIKTIAEGVNEEELYNHLSSTNINYIQGRHIGSPFEV